MRLWVDAVSYFFALFASTCLGAATVFIKLFHLLGKTKIKTTSVKQKQICRSGFRTRLY